MKLGIIILALFLVCGSMVMFFAAATSAPVRYTDTYNTPQSGATNTSQDMVINGTGTTTAVGGGVAVLLGIMAIAGSAIFLVGVFRSKTRKTSSYR
jgi:hypothetical protein